MLAPRAQAAGAVALVLAAGTALSPSAAPASSRPLPRCAVGHLAVRVASTSAAAGHRYWNIELRNRGRTSCVLQGFPAIGLLDRTQGLFAVTVANQPGWPAPRITVAPGRRAYFTFGYTVSGPCGTHSFTAFALAVYPPSDSRYLTVSIHGGVAVCGTHVGGDPVVYPLRRGLALSPS
jgi:hypothetical protein